jgi:hypothetical protein
MRFDPNTVDDNEFPVLPAGTHRVIVDKVELKSTIAGTGKRLSVKFVVAEGPSKGIVVFHNFNVENASDVAQRIGRAELKKFLAAIGIQKAVDLDRELPRLATNKVLFVQTESGEYQGKPQANIKAFAPASAAQRQQRPLAQPEPDTDHDNVPF